MTDSTPTPDRRSDPHTRDRLSQIFKEIDDRIAIMEDEVTSVIRDNAHRNSLVRKAIVSGSIGFALIVAALVVVALQFRSTSQADQDQTRKIAEAAESQTKQAAASRRVSSQLNCQDKEDTKGEIRLAIRQLLPEGIAFPRNPTTGRPLFAPIDPGKNPKLSPCKNYAIERNPDPIREKEKSTP